MMVRKMSKVLKWLFPVAASLLLAIFLASSLAACLPTDQRLLKEGDRYYDAGDKLNVEGKSSEALKQYDLAVQQYSKALEANPQSIPGYLSRGAAYTELGKYDEALKDLGQVIQMDPENTMAYYQRAMTEIFAQKYDQSIADSNQCIKLGLENHFVYYNRGVAYARKGNYEFALADFTKAKTLTNSADFIKKMDGEINQLRTAMGK